MSGQGDASDQTRQQQQRQVVLPSITGQSGNGGKGKADAVLQPQPAGVTKTLTRTQKKNRGKAQRKRRQWLNSPAGQAQAQAQAPAQGERQGNAATDDDAQANAPDNGVPGGATPATAAPALVAPAPPSMPVVPEDRMLFVRRLERMGRSCLLDFVDVVQRNEYAIVTVPWYARRIAQEYGGFEDQAYIDLENQAEQGEQSTVQWCWLQDLWSLEYHRYYDAVHKSS